MNSLINTAVIPAAGLGTRLTPFTKEIPKEMLPIIVKSAEGVVVKPILHYIFESLYSVGVRNFYFVVGRGKRVIEDYFTPDYGYVDFLNSAGKSREASILKSFYERVEDSNIVVVNQPTPRGFGDAVLRTKPLVSEKSFIVHAGDDIVYPNHEENLVKLIDHYLKYEPSAAFLYDVSETPEMYGVIAGEDRGEHVEVSDIVEKPKTFISRNVVVAIYVFEKQIYEALEATRPSSGEHQLTDAIRLLVKSGERVHAVKVSGRRLDFGTPDQYLQALKAFVEL